MPIVARSRNKGGRVHFLTISSLLKYLVFFFLAGCRPESFAQEVTRVATYNIKFFESDVATEGNRLDNLREVVSLLNADVIGLQEIRDREALELLFPPDEGWQIVIDDDSGDPQDVALVVKAPYRVKGMDSDLDADDAHFLFPDSEDNSHFPIRRDVLTVEVELPEGNGSFYVMVVHAKSRSGGRAATDPRRAGAARDMVEVLRRDFSDAPFVLLGDFNDNPDDESLNILETGNPNALPGPEEIEGPFLLNVTEPLVAEDRVSWGIDTDEIVGNQVNTVVPGSRKLNNDTRGTRGRIAPILFDQILIPTWMATSYIPASAKIFDHPSSVRQTQASDHLPVFADFVFEDLFVDADDNGGDDVDDDIVDTSTSTVRISALLPNPHGIDSGNEEITIANDSDEELHLTGWSVRDEAGNVFPLAGVLPPHTRLTVIMLSNSMPLNNTGDIIILSDPEGQERHQVTYTGADAQEGAVIVFN